MTTAAHARARQASSTPGPQGVDADALLVLLSLPPATVRGALVGLAPTIAARFAEACGLYLRPGPARGTSRCFVGAEPWMLGRPGYIATPRKPSERIAPSPFTVLPGEHLAEVFIVDDDAPDEPSISMLAVAAWNMACVRVTEPSVSSCDVVIFHAPGGRMTIRKVERDRVFEDLLLRLARHAREAPDTFSAARLLSLLSYRGARTGEAFNWGGEVARLQEDLAWFAGVLSAGETRVSTAPQAVPFPTACPVAPVQPDSSARVKARCAALEASLDESVVAQARAECGVLPLPKDVRASRLGYQGATRYEAALRKATQP